MDPIPLHAELAHLLTGHGVDAHVDGDRVELPALRTWATLLLGSTESGGHIMEVRASTPTGAVVVDTWAALGASREEARRDGRAARSPGCPAGPGWGRRSWA